MWPVTRSAFLEGLFQQVPGFLAAGLVAAQHHLAVTVFHPLEENLHVGPGLDLAVFAGLGEFLQGNAAFGLEANVDDHVVAFDGDHAPPKNGSLEGRTAAKLLIEQGGEILLRRCGARLDVGHAVRLPFVSIAIQAGRLSPAVFPAARQGPCVCQTGLIGAVTLP